MQAGGPDGGDGGRGGDVMLRAPSERMHTLMDFRYHAQVHRRKRRGRQRPTARRGKSGANVVIEVPPGTVVREASHAASVLLDLYAAGRCKDADAGAASGGFGNQHFRHAHAPGAAVRQAGREAARAWSVTLELKSIADVGLVGFPERGQVHDICPW